MENSLAVKTKDDDGKLDVADLVRMFEESEESTLESRGHAERDRDYYDSIQYTAEELDVLKKRGQPPVIDNRIKTKIDYLVGLEKQQRIDPRALPRTPQHETDADGASQALKYVSDSEGYDAKRSGVWRNLLIEGSGGISVAVEPGYDGQMQIVLRRWAWDRMFSDPHSAELDYSDAGYIGGIIWMDYVDALELYKDGKDILDATMDDRASLSETYDDKPKFRMWADKKRKRVRICQIWLKRGKTWYFAEFTKGGILKSGPSPYVDDKGESDCEMFFQSSYKDRDNNVYGLVREMVSLQDAINKRSSKSLHLLNTAQIVTEDGAVNDIEKTRREAARPDGVIVVNPGYSDKFKFETRTDLATGHFQLLQDAKNSIDLKGPNATMLGDKAQGSSSASGKAIIASQQGGMIQLGDLMDNLRHLDKRVFRAIWNRIRQFWTAEKWIRVTDEEKNIKWVGINVDPQRVQAAMQQDPSMQEKIKGVVGNVAQLDCDIIIDEVPDSLTPALEQWQGLVELAKAGVPIPPDVLIKSAPNLKNKDALIEHMSKPNPQAVQAQQVQMAGEVAKVKDTEAASELKKAQTAKTLVEAHMAPGQMQGQPQEPQQFELPPDVQIRKAMAETDALQAKAGHTRAQAVKTAQEAALAPHEFAHQVRSAEADRAAQQRAKQPA